MSKTINVSIVKREAVIEFNKMPVDQRLKLANWTPNNMEPSLSSKLGALYYGQVRIWITPDGTLYANKPKVN